MIKEVDLISYLPLFIQEYDEIQRIMNTENPEFQLIWDENERTRNNLYIQTATEQGLKRFEKILGIFPSTQDTYESRRGRILSRWNDTVPYTLKSLIAKIKVICGDNFELTPHFSEYMLELITHIGFYGGVDDLAYILKTVIPVNIEVNSSNLLDCKSTGNLFIGSTLAYVGTYLMTNDFEAMYVTSGTLFNGSTMVLTSVELMTNDFEAAYSAQGQINTKSAAVITTQYLMTNDFETTITADGQHNIGSTAVIASEYTMTNDFETVIQSEGSLLNGSTTIVVTNQNI